MAAVPLIDSPAWSVMSVVHRSAPVEASTANTEPPPDAATRVPPETTGVPVKSPLIDFTLQTGRSDESSFHDGPHCPDRTGERHRQLDDKREMVGLSAGAQAMSQSIPPTRCYYGPGQDAIVMELRLAPAR